VAEFGYWDGLGFNGWCLRMFTSPQFWVTVTFFM
jgi:hypothetical protein